MIFVKVFMCSVLCCIVGVFDLKFYCVSALFQWFLVVVSCQKLI